MAWPGDREIHLRKLETAACRRALVCSTETTGLGGEERSTFHQEKCERIEPLLSTLGEVGNAVRSAAADVQQTTGFQEPPAGPGS